MVILGEGVTEDSVGELLMLQAKGIQDKSYKKELAVLMRSLVVFGEVRESI